jgi:hypothetical protein
MGKNMLQPGAAYGLHLLQMAPQGAQVDRRYIA